jgi:hypothetical protein
MRLRSKRSSRTREHTLCEQRIDGEQNATSCVQKVVHAGDVGVTFLKDPRPYRGNRSESSDGHVLTWIGVSASCTSCAFTTNKAWWPERLRLRRDSGSDGEEVVKSLPRSVPCTILLISGSLRGGSVNTAVLRTARAIATPGVALKLYGRLGDLPHFQS